MIIQASITGFKGRASTILGFFDEDTSILVVAKELPKLRLDKVKPDSKEGQKPQGVILITDSEEIDGTDFIFTDDHLHDAIRSYFTKSSLKTIDIIDTAKSHMPDTKIEQDSIDASGRKYRVSSDITNGQMAILAMCAYLEILTPVNSAMDAMAELTEIYDNSIISI